MRTRRPATTSTTSLPRAVVVLVVTVLATATLAAGTQAAGRATGEAAKGAETPGPVTAAGDAGSAAQDVTASSTDTSPDARAHARARRRAQIRQVQRRLAHLGWYEAAVDGLDGPRTDAAIRGFQRAAGLTVDGIVGPATRRALEAEGAVTRAEWKASRPAPTTSATPSRAPSSSAPSEGSRTSAPDDRATPACDLQCRGERIIAMAPLSAPASYDVVVRSGRDGYLGMTHGSTREIVLYVADDHTDREVAATLLHEIGHAYDFLGLGGRGDDARRQWAEARGFDWDGRDAWFGNGCSGCSDYSIGAGDLAEAVHACWAPGWDSFRSQLAGPPTTAQCDLLAQVLR